MRQDPPTPLPGEVLALRPRFLLRRRWRAARLLMVVAAAADLLTGFADLAVRGWTRQAAIEIGVVPIFASGAITFMLLGRIGMTLQGEVLTVRDFLRSDAAVPLSRIRQVLTATQRYPGGARRVYVLVSDTGRTVAVVPERLYPPDALASLLARLPAPEASTPVPLREIRRRCPPAARLSTRLLGILAVAYLLMCGGLAVLVVSATMPRPSP
jgi:hypothetical protein